MEISKAKQRFEEQKRRADQRGIGFFLTFNDWLEMWGNKFDERGRNRGQYVMCRKNDLGPYAVGNCYIATGKHNLSVRGHLETRTNAIHTELLTPKSERFRRGDPIYELIAQEEAEY